MDRLASRHPSMGPHPSLHHPRLLPSRSQNPQGGTRRLHRPSRRRPTQDPRANRRLLRRQARSQHRQNGTPATGRELGKGARKDAPGREQAREGAAGGFLRRESVEDGAPGREARSGGAGLLQEGGGDRAAGERAQLAGAGAEDCG